MQACPFALRWLATTRVMAERIQRRVDVGLCKLVSMAHVGTAGEDGVTRM